MPPNFKVYSPLAGTRRNKEVILLIREYYTTLVLTVDHKPTNKYTYYLFTFIFG